MACTDCFTGCMGEVISDKCVKYTGPDIPLLDICTGDPVSEVERLIIEKILTLIDGTGIDLSDITIGCASLTTLLDGDDKTLARLIQLLVDNQCTLRGMIDTINTTLSTSYVFDDKCLTFIGTGTRDDILQTLINELCLLIARVDAIESDYVKATDLNGLIAQYITNNSNTTNYYTRMVPYTVMEYYGPLSNFDGTGKGLLAFGFDKIYLCNGLNGTPDHRGRVGVGAVANVPGATLDAEVDPVLPANAGNNYALGNKFGISKVALTTSEMPAHTHPLKYKDFESDETESGTEGGGLQDPARGDGADYTVTTESTGSGNAHENRQPSIAAYFVQYRPA